MGRLLAAGILYLVGVAIVLILKPESMFTEDGAWKEFGIGRNPKTHTWVPFWLFSVLWALVSYILITVGFAMAGIGSEQIAEVAAPQKKTVKEVPEVEVIDDVFDAEAEDFDLPPIPPKPRGRRSRGVPMDLPDGYYVLNTRATEAAGGIPKYVYLGRGLPE
jgi:hypothetical protein